MKKLLIAAGVLAFTSAATDANAAQPRWPLWYVGLSGGVTFLEDTDISGGATGNLDFKEGGNVALAIGYNPPMTLQPFSNMRFEFEVGYHYNGTDSLTLGGVPTATGG